MKGHSKRRKMVSGDVGKLLGAGFISVALLLAGCTSGNEQSLGSGPVVSEGTMGAPSREGIDWKPCSASQVTMPLFPEPKDLDLYECGVVKAPLNWDEPEGGRKIDLAIARYVKAGKDAQPLFFNLGGPGGDAVESLSLATSEIFNEDITGHYQIVAIDPRGVGESTPIRCRTDAEIDEEMSSVDLVPEDPQKRIGVYTKQFMDFAKACEEKSGDILGFVDTDSVSRDFEMVREMMGAEKLNYVGYSYGTSLGAIFANNFPDKVGRMVLDGALDPGTDSQTLILLQAEGMENALYHWIEWCVGQKDCPLSEDTEKAKQEIIDLMDGIAEKPIPAGDANRPLNYTLAQTGIIGSLYGEDSYPLLLQGISTALNGNGQILLFLADYYNGRQNDGTYSNTQDASAAINALEMEPSGTLQDWIQEAEDLATDYPILGGDFGYGSAGIESWPFEPRVPRKEVSPQGAPPIVIIGTLHDPATPYVMAESLAESIPGSVLITVDGWSHGAYMKNASKCLRGAVDPFLLEGKVPEPVTCS